MFKMYPSSPFLNSDFRGWTSGFSIRIFMTTHRYSYIHEDWEFENSSFSVLFINHLSIIYIFYLISILLLLKIFLKKTQWQQTLWPGCLKCLILETEHIWLSINPEKQGKSLFQGFDRCRTVITAGLGRNWSRSHMQLAGLTCDRSDPS